MRRTTQLVIQEKKEKKILYAALNKYLTHLESNRNSQLQDQMVTIGLIKKVGYNISTDRGK